MTTFKSLEEAREFAEFRIKGMVPGESVYIMKKSKRGYSVTNNLEMAIVCGWALVETLENNKKN